MEDGNFRIRDARPEDCAAIMKMIVELAVNSHLHTCLLKCSFPVRCLLNLLKLLFFLGLQKDILEPGSIVSCIVAEYKSPEVETFEVIGYSVFFYTYSTWKGKVVYMEDLYIMKEFRGK
ncbi:diamine acetyltransferase 1-like [Antedon mediterranea]|uniref:diamine acetyltransferase 1-like n=1 Tax=Antedon mediterranea TaxID=105859 RepID=UPI003AF8743B